MNEQKEKNLRDKMLPEDEVPYTKERGLLDKPVRRICH